MRALAAKDAARACLLLAGVLAAQSPRELVVRLWSSNANVVEDARRRLCLAPASELPQATLVRLLRHRSVATVRAAASILACQGLATKELRASLARSPDEVRRILLPLARDQELMGILADPHETLRVAALYALQDRGRLTRGELVKSLEDPAEDLAWAARTVLLSERAPLSPELFSKLKGRARHRLILGLGQRPRPGALPWLLGLLQEGELQEGERLAAIAALPSKSIDLALAKEVLAAASRPELAIAARSASLHFSPAVADRLVGAVHHELVKGAPVDVMLPLLYNATALGDRQLVSLVGVLPDKTREYVCGWLSSRGSVGLDAHVQSALDGETPLEDHLLRRAGPFLDRRNRIARVRGLLRDGGEKTRLLAFLALAHAKIFSDDMLEFALRGGAQRVRLLLGMGADLLPGQAILTLLDAENPQVVQRTCMALAAAAFPRAVERRLIELAEESPSNVAAAAAHAVLARGGDRGVLAIWARHPDANFRATALSFMLEQRRPWLLPWLREELARQDRAPGGQGKVGGDRRRLRAYLLWALARLGEAGASTRLLRALPSLGLHELRRFGAVLTHAVRPADLPWLRRQLLGPAAIEEQARVEITQSLGRRPDLQSASLLAALHRQDPSEEVRLEALRSLLSSGHAAPFHARLREALEHPLGSENRDLAFEVVGNLPQPTGKEGLDLLARLLLLAPLAEPLREAEASLGGYPRGADYPFYLAIVDHLRRDPEVSAEPFAVVAAEVRRHPGRHALSGRRLGYFLVEIAKIPHLRRRIAPVFARLILETIDLQPRFLGAAHLILAEQAERQGAFDRAAKDYLIAARELLRHPLPPLLQRALLGDADPRAEFRPMSWLAARSEVARARNHLAHGRAKAARAACKRALALGFGDRQTREEIHGIERRLLR